MTEENDFYSDGAETDNSNHSDENFEPEVVESGAIDDGVEENFIPVVRGQKALASVDPLAAYLHELRKYETLTEEEEKELAVLYKETGDTSAVYRLITSNLNLVVQVAMRFRREWRNMMDLIQEGNIGLMHAVNNFDPFRGVRLPVYARWWIKAYILKFILDNWRLVRIGTTNTRRKLLYNLTREKEKLEREGFVPSTKMLAERFGVNEKEVIDVQAGLGASDVSMDMPVKGDSGLTPAHYLSDGIHPEQDVVAEQLREVVRQVIDSITDSLKPIEREIIDCRVMAEHPQSLQEIGERYNVTREAVRQSEQRLMKKLREHFIETIPEAEGFFK